MRGYVQFNKYTHTHTQLKMLDVPAYTYECRSYSTTCIRLALPSTLSLPSAFVPSARLMVGASPRAQGFMRGFSCGCRFWDERGGGLTPVGPQVDTATIRTVLGTTRVDSGSFSSRCCAFRRTHTNADCIRLLCIRLALLLTLSLPSRFAPSERLMLGGTLCALWLVGDFSCDSTVCFGKEGRRTY